MKRSDKLKQRTLADIALAATIERTWDKKHPHRWVHSSADRHSVALCVEPAKEK